MEEKALIDQWFPSLDEEIRRNLARHARIARFRKNQILLEAGERQNSVYFLIQGCIRGFVVDEDGRDITDCFACRPSDLVMACSALGETSVVGLETVAESRVLMIPVSELEHAMARSMALTQIYACYLRKALEFHWEAKMLLYRCTAMQRYHWFLNRYPGLIDTISNKHIASFLGMTPVTLSRLRRQLRTQAENAPGEAAE